MSAVLRLSSTSMVSSWPADHQHVGVEHAAVEAGALEQAAGQREDPRPSGGGLVPGRRHPPSPGRRPARRAGCRASWRVSTSSITCGTPASRASAFLATQGPTKTQLTSGAVQLLDRQRGGDHRRDDRHEAVGELGMVLAHVLGHRRARGSDVQPGGVGLEVLLVGVAHQVGALGDLDDVVEPGRLEGADDLVGRLDQARPGTTARAGRRRSRPVGRAARERCSIPLRYALAFCEQTSVQLPQAMQRSSTTKD